MNITILDNIISGILIGGIYSIIAMGLSLQYGVARVFNIAHGEFIMLGAFGSWILFILFNVNPIISLLICGPILFLIGFFLHKTMFKKLADSSKSPKKFEAKSLMGTFGLLFIIQNFGPFAWGLDLKGLGIINLAGVQFEAKRLITLVFALLIGLIFYLFLTYTRIGKAIRATAQNTILAKVMGVNINNVLALCFGLGTLMAAFAGTFLAICFPTVMGMGMEYTFIAVIIVVLGGLGSIIGSFIGGLILGITGSMVSYIDPSLQMITYYTIFILLLLIRPKGLMGK